MDRPLKRGVTLLQNIQKICSVCEEVIEGTYYTLNDQVYCEKDYKVIIHVTLIKRTVS
jgi:hypothetical protein